eukprot:8295105-Pyramimonas_sp.AAC.1
MQPVGLSTDKKGGVTSVQHATAAHALARYSGNRRRDDPGFRIGDLQGVEWASTRGSVRGSAGGLYRPPPGPLA